MVAPELTNVSVSRVVGVLLHHRLPVLLFRIPPQLLRLLDLRRQRLVICQLQLLDSMVCPAYTCLPSFKVKS
jgi:hypothetical protein